MLLIHRFEMAKKKRKEPKEVFKEPEFDEVEFMRNEMTSTKASIVAIIYAIPVAIVSFGLTVAGLAAVGFLVGIIAIFMLKYLFDMLKVSTEGFEKKTWFMQGALTFFVWILVWILLLNPPFSDVAEPTIKDVEMWQQSPNGSWTNRTVLQLSGGSYQPGNPLPAGSVIKLKLNASDNTGLNKVTISVLSGGTPGDTLMERNTTYTYNYEYDYTLSQSNTVYTFRIVAIDVNGNANDAEIIIRTS
jgi:hypothetical protein